MKFHDNNVVETTVEVWRAIREAHKDDMVVFSSYSSSERMETCWGFKGAENPTMCAQSDREWSDDYSVESKLISEQHRYMLVVPETDKYIQDYRNLIGMTSILLPNDVKVQLRILPVGK